MPDQFENENRPPGSYTSPPGVDPGEYFDWRRRRYGYRRSPGTRLIFAIFLIVGGVLLFLDNIGLFEIHNIWAYSPLFLSVWGVSILSGSRSAKQSYWGVLLIALGILAVLNNLGFLRFHTRDDSWVLALLLIALGVGALLKTVDSNPSSRPHVGFSSSGTGISEDRLDEHVVGGGLKRRVETVNFGGGELHAVFSGIEIDLRYAQISPRRKPVTIEIHAVFSGVKVRVPDSWRVDVHGAGVFGAFEDKTIPGRAAAGEIPDLIITGAAVFGGVEVEN